MSTFNVTFAGFNVAFGLWLIWQIAKVRRQENQLKHLIDGIKNGTIRESEE